MENDKIRVLFVCLGNICRSPLAEGVFRAKVEKMGLADRFHIESAGTGNWHIGEPPDGRMQKTARSQGIEIGHQRGQQFSADFFNRFDIVLAMDRNNLRDIKHLDPARAYDEKVYLFREFDPEADNDDVPDPYYGGERGFLSVFEIVDRTTDRLLEHLTNDWQRSE